MSESAQNLQDLQLKLQKLEESLKVLLKNTEAELQLAALIQKQLFKDRLPEITGVKCLSRYISSYGVSAEGFEVFSTNRGRDVWLIGFWTETFGLSSLLMQTLLHFQGQVAIKARENNTGLAEIFNDLSISLSEAKKTGHYRLTLARLDSHSLKLEAIAIGALPFIVREQKGKAWQTPVFLDEAQLADRPDWIEPANSAAPVTADRAYTLQAQLRPGQRLFYFGNSWRGETSIKNLSQTLTFSALKPDSVLVDDLNALFVAAEADLEKRQTKADLCAIAFEIEAGKLHLA